MNIILRVLQATMILGFAFCISAVAQTLPKCSDNKVQYAPFDANYAKRIALEVTTNTQVTEQAGEKALLAAADRVGSEYRAELHNKWPLDNCRLHRL